MFELSYHHTSHETVGVFLTVSVMGLLFLSSSLQWLAVAVVLFTSVWYYFMFKYSFWKKKGVRFIKPVIPFGNITNLILLRKAVAEVMKELYDKFPEEPYVGIYELLNPMLLIRDTELIKQVMVKDFSHFQDRGRRLVDEESDPLGAHLLNLTGTKWKILRSKLTPTFTSGKMKMMFNLVTECADQLKQYLDKPARNGEILEMKGVMAKFTTDIIGSCAFGLQCNSITDSDSEFRKMGRRVFEPSTGTSLRRMLRNFSPRLLKVFRVRLQPEDVISFFMGAVKDVIDYREKNSVVRNDFMELLIQLKNKGTIHDDEDVKSEHVQDETAGKDTEGTIEFTDSLIASQAFLFFAAGFETSSTALSFCLLELAINPEIQERLSTEIDTTLGKYKGMITYDGIQNMSYLHKVVDETLRKHPPAPVTRRVVTKPYVIPGTSVHLDVGVKILIPIYGLHHDPKYFPEPEVFNPENFSDEIKAMRPNHAYLPFGDGPRNCIGMRFGLLQVKVGLVILLSNFKFSVCEKTQLPVKLDPRQVITTSPLSVWLRVNKRSSV